MCPICHMFLPVLDITHSSKVVRILQVHVEVGRQLCGVYPRDQTQGTNLAQQVALPTEQTCLLSL